MKKQVKRVLLLAAMFSFGLQAESQGLIGSGCGVYNTFCAADEGAICRSCNEDCTQTGMFGYKEYGSLRFCSAN